MNMTIIIAIVAIAVIVVAVYYFATNKGSTTNNPSSYGGPSATGSITANDIATSALDQELNSATQNTSTSDIEKALANQ